ncbi:MAG: hypothetical protein FD189_1113 [Elusimicrobia bacterium]|nr:MAG: hypothetical protein FD189_1113 [Elusimicrobiota bacterium]
MALWDVQVDARDGRIIAVRPAGFRHWGTGDDVSPLRVLRDQELGLDYDRKVEISLERGGDGLTRDKRELERAAVLAEAPKEEVAAELPKLTVAQLDAEIQRRGYKPLSLAQALSEV